MDMMRRLVVVVVLWTFAGVSTPAEALSCASVPMPVVAARAAAIFEATVVSVAVHPVPVTRSGDGLEPGVVGGRAVTAELRDGNSLRGLVPDTIESVERVLEAGRRYLIVAMEYPQHPGVLVAGECSGYVRPAARADAFKAWLESLGHPSTGGRIMGSVLARANGGDVSGWPSVAGARVTARGPVTRETTSLADGQFAIAHLPDGEYEVSVKLPDRPHGLLAPKPMRAKLAGAHALWDWDIRVEIDGVVTGAVVDDENRPVGSAPIALHARLPSGAVADHADWSGKTTADGRYEFRGVAPGNYVVTLGDPYVPAHARTPGGSDELVVGFAERLELAPVVADRGTSIQVEGVVVDGRGMPVQAWIFLSVLGPYGPYPMSASVEETDADGRFRLQLVSGLRYRFTTVSDHRDGRSTADVVADGSPIRLVFP